MTFKPRNAIGTWLRIILALSLCHGPVAFAANEPAKSAAWGQDGWPSIPNRPQPDQEWTGGEGKKRPVGPDGKSEVRFTGERDSAGRPTLFAQDKQGRMVIGTLKDVPEGKTFASAVEFTSPDFEVPDVKKPATKIERLADTVVSKLPGMTPPTAQNPPAWGTDGWPALPARPQPDQEWTGGTGNKRPVGPDGHSTVRFTGEVDIDGRPIVFAPDSRTNKIMVGKLKARPTSNFRQSVDFEISVLPGYSDAHVPPLDPGPPSKWERASGWTARKTRAFNRALKQGLSSRDALMKLNQGALGQGAAETAATLSRFPISAVSFGIALGLSAAYRLQFDYPNNPIAWSKYTEQMSDPIGWISLAGFSVGMALVLRAFEASPKNFLTQLPIFIGSLSFGAVIQTGIEVFARDEDVSACMGFTNFRKTGNPFDNSRENPFKPRDMKACDRAYAKVTSGQLAITALNSAIPSLAAIAVSGSIFYVLLYQIERSVLLQRLLSATRVGAGSSTVGLVVQGAISVGLTALFLKMTEAPQAIASTWWHNYRTASGTGDGPLYAGNLQRAENDLFAVWEKARASGWSDPDVFTPTTDVCFDQNRIGSKYYDCADKTHLDFAGVLETYRGLNLQWRQNQLQSVLTAYKDWMDKASAYGDLVAQTKDFYKKAVEKILYTRNHPNAPADDPNVFNEKNMKVDTRSTILPPVLRSMLYKTPLLESYAHTWRFVSTPRLDEYLATSLACGAEAEGQSEGGFLTGLGRFYDDWVALNPTPRQMIEDEQGLFIKTKGYKVIFHPPRLTSPLIGTTDSICQKAWSSGWSKRAFPERFFWSRVNRFAPGTLDKFEVSVNGKSYDGIFSYIQDNIRPSVITPEGLNEFESWWNEFVNRQDEALRTSMYTDFKKVIEGPFKVALKEKSYYWCDDNSKVAGTKLEGYMRRLRMPGDSCGAQRSHRLAYGVMNNLRDQARLYIAMMIDLYVSNSNVLTNPMVTGANGTPRYPLTVASAENAVIMPARKLVESYDTFVSALVEGSDDNQANEAASRMNEAFNDFLKIVYNDGTTGLNWRGQPLAFGVEEDVAKVKATGEIVTLAARPNMQAEWMLKLATALKQSMAEWTAYAQIAVLQ